MEIMVDLLQSYYNFISYAELLCQSFRWMLKYQPHHSIPLFLRVKPCGLDVLMSTVRYFIQKKMVTFPASSIMLCAQLSKDVEVASYFNAAGFVEDLTDMLQYLDICQRLKISDPILQMIHTLNKASGKSVSEEIKISNTKSEELVMEGSNSSSSRSEPATAMSEESVADVEFFL